MAVLVTGGAGYIGTHTVIKLVEAKRDVVIVDNLANSKEEGVKRVEKILGKNIPFYKSDVCDLNALRDIFEKENIDSVIHFAGLKAVGESCQKPLEYYENNIVSMLNVIRVMREYNVKNLVFSSSATVYGDPIRVPINESFALHATNPYGRTKLFIEEILRDVTTADGSLNVALLRYFNPIGAHESGTIGEDPNDIPNNLMPYITQVAIGKLTRLNVFGNDYNTPDGTGVRDYIHVCDLANGHVLALNKLETGSGLVTYNLGTGNGYSVMDIVRAFEKASGKTIPYRIVSRRPGDIAQCYADPSLALKEIGFKAQYDLNRMCEDSWRWQSQNPKGYN